MSAVVRARRTVEAGVTTVRDLGGREYAELAVRDAVRAGVIPGPRVLCAGRAVCITGGHGWRLLGRQADLVTDALRAAALEMLGYRVDVIEFVSAEHTAKNVMLRAERAPSRSRADRAAAEYLELRDRWGVEPAIERLLPLPVSNPG